MGGATTKIQGGGHKWNKFGSFGWRNILNGLGQAFLQDFGPRVVRPNREGVDSIKQLSQGQSEIYFWNEKQAIKKKIRNFKRKSKVLDKISGFLAKYRRFNIIIMALKQ